MSTQYQDASESIIHHQVSMAAAMAEQQNARHPGSTERDGEQGRRKGLPDADRHLDYLAEALAVEQPLMFADYVEWATIMLAGHNIPFDSLKINLEGMCDALRQHLDAASASVATEYVAAGVDQLGRTSATLSTFISDNQPLSGLAKNYLEALLAGERQSAKGTCSANKHARQIPWRDTAEKSSLLCCPTPMLRALSLWQSAYALSSSRLLGHTAL
jgi:hypothetical protein